MTDPITASIRRYPGIAADQLRSAPLDHVPYYPPRSDRVYKPRRQLRRAIIAGITAAALLTAAVMICPGVAN